MKNLSKNCRELSCNCGNSCYSQSLQTTRKILLMTALLVGVVYFWIATVHNLFLPRVYKWGLIINSIQKFSPIEKLTFGQIFIKANLQKLYLTMAILTSKPLLETIYIFLMSLFYCLTINCRYNVSKMEVHFNVFYEI